MLEIRKMTIDDKQEVLDMMRVFYASPAVSTNGSDQIFINDIDNCVNECPFLEGYVFTDEDKILGYGMLAKSYSTEFGKPCIWIEDVYIKSECRGLGIGSKFLAFIEENFSNCLLRLEVEEDNEAAVHVYKKNGFDFLPYQEMKKELK